MSFSKLQARGRENLAAGVCRACGGDVDEGKQFCPDHLFAMRQSQRELRAERRAAGLCSLCGKVPVPTRAPCAGCQDAARRRAAERAARTPRPPETAKTPVAYDPEKMRSWRKASVNHAAQIREAGRCYHCRAPSPRGTIFCRDCTDDIVYDALERRAERRAAGLCGCGRVPRRGKALCAICARRYRRIVRELRARRRSAGICRQCKGARAGVSAFCLAHKAANLEAQRRRRRRRAGLVLRSAR